MTDDLISRQAAIDAVSRGCQEFRGIFAECEKNLNELPSTPHWIPVTERLPEPGKEVLIILEGMVKIGYIGTHDIEDNWFKKIAEATVWYTDRAYYYPLDKVTAWMSLPEPWKGGEES